MVINKKIVIGVLIAAVLVFGLVISWVILEKKEVSPSEKITEEETDAERELKKLEELRGEVLPLTEEEIQKQLEELKELRQSQQYN